MFVVAPLVVVVGAVGLMGAAWARGAPGGHGSGGDSGAAGGSHAAGGEGQAAVGPQTAADGGQAAVGPQTAGDGGQAAVVYHVSAAEQRATRAYWTPARMEAAQRAAVPQAAAVPNGSGPPKGTPTASLFTGVPTVGALFAELKDSDRYTNHYCTASVVDSSAGDIILTAAHCIYSTEYAVNVEYIPEWREVNGKVIMPYGGWVVQDIWIAAGWKASPHDTEDDFAFMTVDPVGGRNIQAVTGGLQTGFNLKYPQKIEAIGYNDGFKHPVECPTKSLEFPTKQGDFMVFYCYGFWDGTSGGPWIIGYSPKNGTGTVFGVIGGYQQGGDYNWASYSAYFGGTARTVLEAAEKEPA